MPTTKIILLGLGELGSAFLPHLIPLPSTHLTVGTPNPSKHASLLASYPTVSYLAIDLTTPSDSLAKAFAAFDILITATGFSSNIDSVTKLTNEVLQAGKIRQAQGKSKIWFFPWQWGVDYDVTGDVEGKMPLFGKQKAVRDLLRERAEESGVCWTIVSTGIFMSFLFEGSWGIIDRSREDRGKIVVRCLKNWEHKVTVTDVDDIGRVLAKIVAKHVEAENCILYIAGDTVSYQELADVIGHVSGKEIGREKWSIPYLEAELKADPDHQIKKYRLVFARDSVYWDKEKTANHELVMSMVDVETYARKLFGNKGSSQ
ncbi:NmrA multi-domain protein [Pyrenophora tritici-repentis]|uniref:NmrA domain containing protein n=2 Tax=Pyrenophora tritici-repentis TaxID=45151 RepID=A0A2W1F872_9PLEO|nr:isoflavone reductase [Pyrenophora tritici-repentis Pt-1C-BFP]KAA8626378.1 NmrA domain-containing protein [Pyrenophora tritici-repentis]EDU41126.1 isoflavone reductase [Pyrenophora tritici-repentis Pt-1C-BFP]KAF7454795.1 NmrA domain containing protein [Pyrenophora tritici-repentis]KAF7577927.1 NmrA multi-domain protein [Pyrenophora tritici-repentis]KAG9388556.1 NmrA domain containing protein [Pyrenophora tritici-repentis]